VFRSVYAFSSHWKAWSLSPTLLYTSDTKYGETCLCFDLDRSSFSIFSASALLPASPYKSAPGNMRAIAPSRLQHQASDG
jgi:hypothetical protein